MISFGPQPRDCGVKGCAGRGAHFFPYGWRCTPHTPKQPATRCNAPLRCYCGDCPPQPAGCDVGRHPGAGWRRRNDLGRVELYCTRCGYPVGLLPRGMNRPLNSHAIKPLPTVEA